ncbi:MAG: prepilin peptidase [Anaerolineae bacterium]
MDILLYTLLGWLMGVFVNRASDNLPPPERSSLLTAPRCSHCGAAFDPLEQSGLVNLLLNRGRCSHCHSPRSWRAPIVEAGMAFLFGLLCYRLGLGLMLFTYSLLTVLLVLITIIDLEHRLILNVVILPATLLTIILVPITRIVTAIPPPIAPEKSFYNSFLGLGIGYAIVAGIYFMGVLFGKYMARRRGKPVDEVAFGMGDVKLAGMVGAVAGVIGIFTILVYAILLGGVVSLIVIVYQLVVHRRYSLFMAIPYGPFFTITTWVFMVLGPGLLGGF